MRIQCPECGILRQANAEPCPSCGADAPSSSEGTRGGSGTSLRQWKERYQTGQLPGISPETSGIGNSRQLSRRTSGPLSGPVNTDWGNDSPAASVPPSSSLGISRRASGQVTPPPAPPASARPSSSLSSSLWQRATDPTPPPPSRTSGPLSASERTGSSESGNSSASWRWQGRGSRTSTSGFNHQMDEADYDDQQDEQDAAPQPSMGRGRSGSMLPVPYQGSRRGWNQSGDYDDEAGDSSNLPATLNRQNSMAFPMMDESAMLQRLAPGRKPPAFIPATRPRRPYRLSRYRVLSGTISLALVLMTVVGGLAFLAVHSGLAGRLLGTSNNLAARSYTFGNAPVPTLSGSPQATPSGNPASQVIVSVTTALHYSSTYDPINPTTTFSTGQNVNVLWKVKNAQSTDVVSVIWYESGNALTTKNTPNTQKGFPKPGPYNGLFAYCYPISGLGKAELYWDGQLAQTIEFVVKGNPASCTNT